MDGIVKSFVDLFIRHALTLAGGSLIAHGWVTQSDWTQATGAIMTLVAIAWSAKNKMDHQNALAAARALTKDNAQ